MMLSMQINDTFFLRDFFPENKRKMEGEFYIFSIKTFFTLNSKYYIWYGFFSFLTDIVSQTARYLLHDRIDIWAIKWKEYAVEP